MHSVKIPHHADFEVVKMEDEKTCRDCKHYRRHYVDIEGRYHEIHDGHCVYPQVKRKRAEDLPCARFTPLEPAPSST